MEALRFKLLLLVAFLVAAAHILEAHIADFDEVWQKRAEKARKAALDAYQPNPENITNELNHRVHEDIESDDGARRKLGKREDGPCSSTNPIDRCWRCDENWARNRKRLASCALGFGRKTTGGKDGRFYEVTDPSDGDLVNPKPGTLRHAVIQMEPLWITFAHDMEIRLSEELIVTDNKTIDGRGANVHISNGAQITIQFVQNVIIHNVHVHDHHPGNGGLIRDSVGHYGIRTRSDGDGISLFGASNVWIDHVSMSNCADGLVDAVEGSTAITISNCHFTKHNEVMLFGASDSYSEDAVMQITVAFNHFGQGLIQRMPRARWGFVHVVNNDYTHWLMYAIGGSQHPTIISQGNRFIAPPDENCKEVTKRDYAPESVWKSWTWRSENDLMMNGAFFVESGSPIRYANQEEMIKAKPGSSVTRLVRYAGALNCVPFSPESQDTCASSIGRHSIIRGRKNFAVPKKESINNLGQTCSWIMPEENASGMSFNSAAAGGSWFW